MLDVHAPEHPIHGVREFFVHLFTITCGLLIALGLENTAEWRHHVHLKHQAEETMRSELRTNRKDVQAAIGAIPEEQKRLQGMMAFLQAREAGKDFEVHELRMGITQATLQDAAWSSATSTGALSYMDYDDVQRFASAYQLQKKFDAVQEAALPPIVGLIASLGTQDPTKMKPEEATLALRDVRLTLANLMTIQGLGNDVDKAYEEALKNE